MRGSDDMNELKTSLTLQNEKNSYNLVGLEPIGKVQLKNINYLINVRG